MCIRDRYKSTKGSTFVKQKISIPTKNHMGKRVILYLFLLFSLSLQAQTEEKVSLGNNSTEVDSTATAKPSAFKRAIKKFMNFSDFDTLYISPVSYTHLSI